MRNVTNKVSIIALVLLEGFALTAQTTAFATKGNNTSSPQGTLVGISGPIHKTSEGYTCESGIGCIRPHCADTNATNGNESKATGNMTDPPKVNATANEFSYKYGYNGAYHPNSKWAKDNPYTAVGRPMDDCRGPDVNAKGQFIPITNKTACLNGWDQAWKDWCTAYAQQCVKDLLVGRVPNFIVATHHQYLAGYNASSVRAGICPADHRNAAFCTGYEDNSDEHHI